MSKGEKEEDRDGRRKGERKGFQYLKVHGSEALWGV